MKASFFLAPLIAATPLALLLPGCSGGNSGIGSIFPTPQPTTAPTPASTSRTSNFTLGNNQRAILKTTQNGTALAGTIQILAPAVQTRTSSALTRSFKIGTFSITGVFTAPRGFNITVKDGSETLFTQSGLFPTATETGTYSITTPDGQTDSGILPKTGDPFPTPKPTVTPTTPPTNGATVNLTFTPSSDATFSEGRPLRGAITRFNSANTLSVNVASVNPQASNSLTFGVTVRPTVGATNTPGNLFLPFSALINSVNSQPRYFTAESGTVRLTALSATSATLEFKNLVYVASEGSLAHGTVTINGTVSGPYAAN